ncbi:uncharacterized protein EI90DRAFT_142077 [Cantharellus anzutake]|uniref:uncharacterized protein n=1 Tax=Cantharellus anzutake TaxID=1750568 RepID=UPI0019082C77|nr:uncharacterized protein EI90DRAFT_142077 [Cantharellus anzutake]KAF8317778.1 hypothetical protein EI90DRAFT_142077 [Cantharellus anzutake]
MTDLSYCYLHMSDQKVASFDFHDKIRFKVEEDVDDFEISEEYIPPDPDDTDCLPSQMHTSYPYGNPTHRNHPAALGTYPFGFGYAHLYSQINYDASSLTRRPGSPSRPNASSSIVYDSSLGPLKWDDLALDQLLPADPKKLEAEWAAKARRSATGAAQNAGVSGAAAPPPPGADTTDELEYAEQRSELMEEEDEEQGTSEEDATGSEEEEY